MAVSSTFGRSPLTAIVALASLGARGIVPPAAAGPAAPARAELSVDLEQLTVQGEAGGDPAQGYVASRSRAGSKTDTPLVKVPQSINVVTREQMNDLAVHSVAESLRYTPGVVSEYRGSSNIQDEMFVRGFSYVPRYLDGLRYGSDGLGQFDPYLLERVEVLKGPASVLYGQANPGGIVNLVSKLPRFVAHREVFVRTGNRNRAEGGFDVGGPLGEPFAYRVVGMGFRVDAQERSIEQERLAIAPSFTWRPDDQTRLTILGSYYHEPNVGFRNFLEVNGTRYRTVYGYIPRSFLVSDPAFDRYRREQASIGYQFEHRINEAVTVRQNARYSVIDTDFATIVEWGQGAGSKANVFTRKAGGGPNGLAQFLIDNQAQFTVATGPLAHTILTGLDVQTSRSDYRWGYARTASRIDWTNPVYGNPGDTAIVDTKNTRTLADQYGLYGQDQIEIDRLNLLVGIRHDWSQVDVINRLDGNSRQSLASGATTWRAGGIYTFDTGIAPYASYSTSFEPVLEAPKTGQPPFKPTEAEQFEAGLKYAPAGAPYEATASYYDLTQTNVLTRKTFADPYTQIGAIRNRGVEFEARAEILDGLSLIASASHIRSEVTKSLDTTILHKMPARIPTDQAALWAKYEVGHGPLAGLGIGAGVRDVGRSWGNGTNTFRVPEVVLFDAMLSYEFGRSRPDLDGLRAQLNVTNLADRRYAASCASATACFWGAGRVVTAQLRYTW